MFEWPCLGSSCTRIAAGRAEITAAQPKLVECCLVSYMPLASWMLRAEQHRGRAEQLNGVFRDCDWNLLQLTRTVRFLLRPVHCCRRAPYIYPIAPPFLRSVGASGACRSLVVARVGGHHAHAARGAKMWDDTADMPFEQRFSAALHVPVGPDSPPLELEQAPPTLGGADPLGTACTVWRGGERLVETPRNTNSSRRRSSPRRQTHRGTGKRDGHRRPRMRARLAPARRAHGSARKPPAPPTQRDARRLGPVPVWVRGVGRKTGLEYGRPAGLRPRAGRGRVLPPGQHRRCVRCKCAAVAAGAAALACERHEPLAVRIVGKRAAEARRRRAAEGRPGGKRGASRCCS